MSTQKKQQTKMEVIRTIMKDVEDDISNEDMIHLILQRQFSANTLKKDNGKLTFGQKAADGIAKFAGSWTFIFVFLLVIVIWMLSNVILLATKAFDPYPFILLNLLLSCVAAIQAPLIMMSQNRQEEKDRQRAENDYIVNLKSEIIIEDLHKKLDEIIKNQKLMLKENPAAAQPPRQKQAEKHEQNPNGSSPE